MDFAQASESAPGFWERPDTAGVAWMDESNQLESSLIEPGTYTLLMYTFPKNELHKPTYHESRVVEVAADEDLVADFSVNY